MPLYRFQIDARLSVGETMLRLQSLVRQDPGVLRSAHSWFGPRGEDDRPFVGRIEGNEFRVYRRIRYRNSFLPQVRGVVDPTPAGARVSVTMHLHPLVAVFIAAWLFMVGMFALTALARWGTGEFRLEPVAMFVLGIAMTLGGFYPEAFKARRFLARALGCETRAIS